ncbi:ABC transporter ATP-binding protein [Andreesenia angusta]|nr:ABC transporter ATP-binding protein [Andreesenia angusta]
MAVIEVKNLTKRYGKSRGIEDVSIEVKEGEIFGFIGPNGSGKSTFIRTLLNFLYPTSGSGNVLGFDIERESHKLKEKVGYVPSEVKYYEETKVVDLIEYAKSFYSEVDECYIDMIVQDLKVDLDKKIGELSYGNKKKVAIVQALMGSPKLLILDEPTNGLDPLIQKKLFEVLRKEKEKGNTVFLSSHNLTEVESLCDRVAIIKQGRIVDTVDLSVLKEQFGLVVEVSGDLTKEDVLKISKEMMLESESHYIFTYSGDVNSLVDWAKDYSLKKLLVEEQNLESEFMKYYLGEGEGYERV